MDLEKAPQNVIDLAARSVVEELFDLLARTAAVAAAQHWVFPDSKSW